MRSRSEISDIICRRDIDARPLPADQTITADEQRMVVGFEAYSEFPTCVEKQIDCEIYLSFERFREEISLFVAWKRSVGEGDGLERGKREVLVTRKKVFMWVDFYRDWAVV